ncbi:MAG: (d)CMP kinase [Proteobacteria bacterium]|nr:(d)CMP kinase [Pseudomonadota bacterium]
MTASPSQGRIAIDGPAASGKTSVARRVGQALGLALVDTGAMYRAVALAAIEGEIALDDLEGLTALAREDSPRYRFLPDPVGEQGYRLLIEGRDVTDLLHTERVSTVVPRVASVSGVRAVLAAEQRRLGLAGGVVMTGRDIGTVVLPEAELKIYMTATAEERARRRVAQLDGGAVDREAAYAEILANIRERDRQDSGRADSPLAQADDAEYLDSTHLTLDQVVSKVLALYETRVAAAGA